MRSNLLAIVVLCLLVSTSHAGWPHNRMVRASGISPKQVGTHEGVGMSTSSFADARNNACYWGQRTPVSIQYNKVGNKYYAVVRYR